MEREKGAALNFPEPQTSIQVRERPAMPETWTPWARALRGTPGNKKLTLTLPSPQTCQLNMFSRETATRTQVFAILFKNVYFMFPY